MFSIDFCFNCSVSQTCRGMQNLTGVGKRGSFANVIPSGEWRNMVEFSFCLESKSWLKQLLIIRSFLAAVGNLEGCIESFLLPLALCCTVNNVSLKNEKLCLPALTLQKKVTLYILKCISGWTQSFSFPLLHLKKNRGICQKLLVEWLYLA